MERSLFGELAVEAGYVTAADVKKMEALQDADAREGGVVRPLGIIGLQEGLLTYRQMVTLLQTAERRAGRMPAGRAQVSRRKSAAVSPALRTRKRELVTAGR